MSTSVSPLGPIDPNSVPEAETEKSAPWIVRKLVGVCHSLRFSGRHLTTRMLSCVPASPVTGMSLTHNARSLHDFSLSGRMPWTAMGILVYDWTDREVFLGDP